MAAEHSTPQTVGDRVGGFARHGWNLLAGHRWAVLVLLVGVGLAAGAVSRLLAGPSIAVDLVQRRDFVQSVVASGHVEAPHRVSIGTQIVGTVKRVPVGEGQVVRAGQPLIELESAESKAAAAQADLAVLQAQARVRQMQEVQEPMAQAALRQAQVTLDNARAQWRRSTDLFRQGFIGQAALDDARKSVDMSEAQMRSALSQFQTVQPEGSDAVIALTTLAQARANAQVAHARLDYALIVAPANGTLIARDVEVGDVVQPGKALMVLSPAGVTELVVQIDEKNLHMLALGQPAQVSADAYPEGRFTATVNYINPGVDVQRGSVEVKLLVNEPPPYLRQDMTVSVDIRTAERPQALVVPSEAVRDSGSAAPWVLKVVNGKAVRQPVRLGLHGGGVTEVLQGLQSGDQIVPATAAGVHDGSHVRASAAGRAR
jgi:HlyD family secretion protein